MNFHSIVLICPTITSSHRIRCFLPSDLKSAEIAELPPFKAKKTHSALNFSALPGRNLLEKADTQRTVSGSGQELNHPSQTWCLSFLPTKEFRGTPEHRSFRRAQLPASHCYEVSSTDYLTTYLWSAQLEIQVSLWPPNTARKSKVNFFRLQEAESPWEGVHDKENQEPFSHEVGSYLRSTPYKPGLLLQSSSLHLHTAVSRDSPG